MSSAKKKGGRKSAWLEKIQPRLEEIAAWARDGLIDKQIAELLDIGESTFDRYKRNKQQLRESLKVNKSIADLRVENALYSRAMGCTVTEITEEVNELGLTKIKTVTKEIPPDTTAGIFFLKNRLPDKWRDKRNLEHSMDPDSPVEFVFKSVKAKKD